MSSGLPSASLTANHRTPDAARPTTETNMQQASPLAPVDVTTDDAIATPLAEVAAFVADPDRVSPSASETFANRNTDDAD